MKRTAEREAEGGESAIGPISLTGLIVSPGASRLAVVLKQEHY